MKLLHCSNHITADTAHAKYMLYPLNCFEGVRNVGIVS